eukprot:CFRG3731T1
MPRCTRSSSRVSKSNNHTSSGNIAERSTKKYKRASKKVDLPSDFESPSEESNGEESEEWTPTIDERTVRPMRNQRRRQNSFESSDSWTDGEIASGTNKIKKKICSTASLKKSIESTSEQDVVKKLSGKRLPKKNDSIDSSSNEAKYTTGCELQDMNVCNVNENMGTVTKCENVDDDSQQSAEDSDYTPLTDLLSSRRRIKNSATVVDMTESENEEAEKKPKRKRARAKKKPKKLTRNERINLLHPDVQGVWDGSDINGRVDFLSENNKVRKTIVDGGPNKSEQPHLLKLKLLPFQLEGVAWLISQEKTEFHGGILADEMGMGKTIQTIALLLSDVSPDKQNLIICPTVALLQWRNEIVNHVKDNGLSVCVFHGPNRSDSHKNLLAYNVVLSTYSVLESEYRRETKGMSRQGEMVKKASTLHQVQWHRIILDEAHNIKDRTSSSARAALSLNSTAKWSLSGTPLQNRVGELYSLIRFMRTYPYSYYFCAKCDCKSLFWKFTDYKHCDQCGCSPMSHFCWWNKEILKPIQKYGNYGEGRVGFVKLGALLEKIMLRRTKLERADDLGLPPRIVNRVKVWFNEHELDFYEALYSQSRTKFLTYVQEGVLLNNYAHIFDLLMKMRQAANHPYLVLYGRGRAAAGDTQDVCGVCQEDAEDAIRAKCKHVFCREDIRMYLNSAIDGQEHPQCPVCFVPLSIDLNQPTISTIKSSIVSSKQRQSILNRMDIGGWHSSSKIEALIEQLALLREKDGTTIKTIVFSQYVSFLDIIEWRLLRSGYRCVKLDGRMTPEQRAAVIDAFMTNHTVTVFLVSLKAGGVALNLTEASRVIMCDPWWNPAVENQAMDRIHRLGQTRPIEVIRLYVENSIESRIIALQEKKRLLFESTIGMDPASLNRLTEEDLGFLFQL